MQAVAQHPLPSQCCVSQAVSLLVNKKGQEITQARPSDYLDALVLSWSCAKSPRMLRRVQIQHRRGQPIWGAEEESLGAVSFP